MNAEHDENPPKCVSQNGNAKSMCARFTRRTRAIVSSDNCDYEPSSSVLMSNSCLIRGNKPCRIGAIVFSGMYPWRWLANKESFSVARVTTMDVGDFRNHLRRETDRAF